ncbi:MAG: M20/M25/M40 family metallo-hydrolase [Candidatus Nanopelagicales bacterium]
MASDTTPPDLAARIADLMPQVRADLEALVRIPSVHFPDYDTTPVVACAEACAELLRDAGAEVELIPGTTGIPTVRAEVPGPPGSPTVLLYSHYDVQPGSDPAAWDSPAFDPTLRDGRLYGRGAADDKSGVVSHIACVRAFDGHPPVTLRILLEGEEEYGGDFEEWPTTRPQEFADLDAAVINDMGPVELGTPTFTTALRGIAGGVVTVRTLEEPRHSGVYGGPAPDALMALIRMLATLTDDRGNCAIAGIPGGEWPGADYPEDTFRSLAGILDGVPLIGDGTLASRLCSRPSVTVVGLDAPAVATAPNAIIPEARAKISVRIPAGVDAEEATEALRRHVMDHMPWGITCEFAPDEPANGSAIAVGGPAYAAFAEAMTEAYDTEPTEQGLGGAVPFVANLVAAFPDLEVIGTGAQDPLARIHAPNESIDLAELQRSITAQALFLQKFAEAS